MMIARVLRHSFCTGAIFSQQQQRRAYGFVPFSQDAIASERDAEATDVDSTGVGVKPPVKSTVVIPLGERPELRVKYENIYGGVRLGVLLEGNLFQSKTIFFFYFFSDLVERYRCFCWSNCVQTL